MRHERLCVLAYITCVDDDHEGREAAIRGSLSKAAQGVRALCVTSPRKQVRLQLCSWLAHAVYLGLWTQLKS